MTTFKIRLIGALCLRSAIYEEVEHDKTANWQAAVIVLAAAMSSGFGVVSVSGWSGMARQALVTLVAWVVASGVLWAIGTKLLPGRKTEGGVDQLLRTLGFAQAPLLFSVLHGAPVIGRFTPLAVAAWLLLATVVTVRQALDYDDTLRALVVCLLGWIAWLAVSMVGALLGLGVTVG